MAVLALVGDPSTAKTFYAQELIKLYYGAEWVGSITPDEANWGDCEAGKRHICYNDVDKMTDLNKRKLIGKVKRKATEGEDGTLNMKGGAIVRATATSQSITSNYAEALPLDTDGKDRRIYVPITDYDAVDQSEMAKAFDPKLGKKEAMQNRIDLLCYLKSIWVEAQNTDKDALKEMLFHRVPMNEAKKELMGNSMADGKGIMHDLAGIDDYEVVEVILPYLHDEKEADHVADMILKEKVDAGDKWFYSEDLLVKIRTFMSAHIKNDIFRAAPSKRQTAEAFIQKKRFTNQRLGNKIQRGMKIAK
jgi:hypothetical protein